MRHRPGRTILIVALAIVALGVVAGIFALLRQGSSAAHPSGVQLATATRSAFDIVTVATGDLQAKKQIELRNQLDSRATIIEVVPEGTLAKKGDVLVRLNAEEIQTEIDEQILRVRTAETQVVAAEAAFEIQKNENESKRRQAELKLALARLAFNQWQNGDHVQKTKDLELALEKAIRDLERLKQKFDQSSDLYAQQFLSFNEYELDRIQLLEAEAALKRAELAKVTYEQYEFEKEQKSKTSDVEEAEAELDRVVRQSEVELQEKVSALENQKAQTNLMQQKLDKLRKQIELCTIAAPTDGLVVYASSIRGDFFDSSGPLQVGREVYPNETLMVLPDVSEMTANVRVHESLAGQIQPGQPATVKVEALGGKAFTGAVESKGVLAEQGGWRDPNRREYTVKIALDIKADGGEQLKPSMRCEAEIRLGAIEDALAIPVQAVFNDGPVRFVYVPKGAKYTRVPVRVGRRSQVTCEILAGLVEGDRVLIREPEGGEVLPEPWDAAKLELVGLKLGEDGQPVAEGEGEGRPGGRQVRPEGGQPPANPDGPGRRNRESGGERRGENSPAGDATEPAADAVTNAEPASATNTADSNDTN